VIHSREATELCSVRGVTQFLYAFKTIEVEYRQEFPGRKSVKIQPSDIMLILLHGTHRILRKPKINKEKRD
jgi:hypothetical protein